MEEIYVNVKYDNCADLKASKNQRGPRSSERRFHGSVVLCLGLLSFLLLVGLIGLGVHYHDSAQRSAAELSSIKVNLTERLQASDNKSSSLTEERDLLKDRITEMTQERDLLKDRITEMTQERDLLKDRITEMTQERDLLKDRITEMTQERDLLKDRITEMTQDLERLQTLSRQKKACPAGWRMFMCSCYLLSSESGSWARGREDCRNRGADLVVIDSTEEQTFLSNFTVVETWSWIGLTDKDNEGTWKWIDGTPLTLRYRYWEAEQPDNGGGDPKWGEEDCAHIRTGKKTEEHWNDRSCDASLRWMCEKKA